MGQKTNPTSLRLNKTNKRFESAWYSKLHYGRLIADDLALRSFIEQLIVQAGLPRNVWSFSPIPKRGRGLILYLSSSRSRAAKMTKLRLRQSPLLLQKSLNSSQIESGTYLSHPKNHSLVDNFYLHRKDVSTIKRDLPVWERRFFVNLWLSQLTCTASRSRALSQGDCSMLQRAHILSWFHGGEQATNSTSHISGPEPRTDM